MKKIIIMALLLLSLSFNVFSQESEPTYFSHYWITGGGGGYFTFLYVSLDSQKLEYLFLGNFSKSHIDYKHIYVYSGQKEYGYFVTEITGSFWEKKDHKILIYLPKKEIVNAIH